MAKNNRQEIDETLLMNIVGGGTPLPAPKATSTEPPIPAYRELNNETAPVETRRRKGGIPEYETTFVRVLNIRPSERLYVRPEIKRMLAEIVQRIGSERMNIQSYVELIVLSHIELYRAEINRLIAARAQQKVI